MEMCRGLVVLMQECYRNIKMTLKKYLSISQFKNPFHIKKQRFNFNIIDQISLYQNKAKICQMQVQDTFIQKKLLYKFDKKIQQVFQSLFMLAESQQSNSGDKMVDEKEENHKKDKYLTRDQILQEIEQLKFQNFKYKTALVSAKKDQTSNQEILKKAQQQIVQSKRQVESLSRDLQYSLKCKRNKEEYNHLAQSLKSSFEPLSVQNSKLSTITKQIEEMQKKYQQDQLDYQKKEKCLRLALSALKCVIENESTQSEQTFGNTLYETQNLLPINEIKIPKDVFNNAIMNGQGIYSGRQQGEQLQGGEIQY